MPVVGSGGAGVYLDIDASDLQEKMARLNRAMNKERFEAAMYGIFKTLPGHVRKILAQDVPQKYQVETKEVKSVVQQAKLTMGGGGVGCIIPLKGTRLVHAKGKNHSFKAVGGVPGWASLAGPYPMHTNVIAGTTSQLPERFGPGNMRPFRNTSAKSLNMVTFVREGKARLPIKPMVGIAVPQMPMTRAKEDVEQDLVRYLENRVDARLRALVLNGY